MLSAFSPSMSVGIPFPVFEVGFMPWDHQEPIFQYPEENQLFYPSNITEPLISNSSRSVERVNVTNCTGLITDMKKHMVLSKEEPLFVPNNIHEPVISNSSGSDEQVHDEPDDSYRILSTVDERKRKRMISNRESARRSRKKKQKHLEDLRGEVSRFEGLNLEMTSRVGAVINSCQLLETENAMLESESGLLQQQLWAINQILIAREMEQMQYNHLTKVTNELNNFTHNLHPLNL